MGAVLKTALVGWWNDRAISLGASIAFFTVFSLAPMLLVAIAVAGLVFGSQARDRSQLGLSRFGMNNEPGSRLGSVLLHPYQRLRVPLRPLARDRGGPPPLSNSR